MKKLLVLGVVILVLVLLLVGCVSRSDVYAGEVIRVYEQKAVLNGVDGYYTMAEVDERGKLLNTTLVLNMSLDMEMPFCFLKTVSVDGAPEPVVTSIECYRDSLPLSSSFFE